MNVDNPDILVQVIKYTDAHRSVSTLAILLELLQIKTEEEAEQFLANELNIGRLFVYLGEAGKFNHNGIYIAVGKEEE